MCTRDEHEQLIHFPTYDWSDILNTGFLLVEILRGLTLLLTRGGGRSVHRVRNGVLRKNFVTIEEFNIVEGG